MLPTHLSYLAIDLPGHGLSSRLPNGTLYSTMNDFYILHFIIKYFKWKKVSLLAHATGAVNCFIYAAAFPDRVDMVIALENLIPKEQSSGLVEMLLPCIEETLIADLQNQNDLEPLSHTYDELLEILNSRLRTKEAALAVLKRGASSSKLRANQFYLNCDNRLKTYYFTMYTLETCLKMAETINCPYLCLNGLVNENNKQYNAAILTVLKRSPVFEYHETDCSNYVHLTNPHLVSQVISTFLNNYRPMAAVAKF